MISRKRLFAILCLGAIVFGKVAHAGTSDQFIRIATGGFNGVYYAIGTSICRIINIEQARTETPYTQRKRCVVLPTSGTPENLRMLGTHADFAIGQSDIVYSNGNDQDRDDSLRTLFALHDEKVTILVAKNPNAPEITTSAREALSAKVVYAGAKDSGHYHTFSKIAEKGGIVPRQVSHGISDDFSLGQRLCKPETIPEDLYLDAVVLVIGSPSDPVREVLQDCPQASILSPTDLLKEEVWDSIKDNSKQVDINANEVYPNFFSGSQNSIPTLAVTAMLVTHSEVDTEKVALVCEAVNAHFDVFVEAHASLGDLTKDALTSRLLGMEQDQPLMRIECPTGS